MTKYGGKQRLIIENIPFDVERVSFGDGEHCFIVTKPEAKGFFMNEKTMSDVYKKAPETWRWFQRFSQELKAEVEANQMNPIEAMVRAYQFEEERWFVRSDRLTGEKQLCRRKEHQHSYEVMAVYPDIDAVLEAMRTLGAQAGMRAALRALIKADLSTEVLRKALQADNGYATESFHAVLRALVEESE